MSIAKMFNASASQTTGTLAVLCMNFTIIITIIVLVATFVFYYNK